MRKVLVSAVAAAVLVAGGCSQWRPPAASVDGTDISAGAVERDAKALRDNPAFAVALLQQDVSTVVTDKRAPASLTAQLLTQRIRQEVLDRAIATRGIEVTDEDRAAARQQLADAVTQISQQGAAGPGATGSLDDVPADYVDRFVDFIADSQALFADVAPEDQVALVEEIFSDVDVTVDPRFGSWDTSDYSVVPDSPPTFGA